MRLLGAFLPHRQATEPLTWKCAYQARSCRTAIPPKP